MRAALWGAVLVWCLGCPGAVEPPVPFSTAKGTSTGPVKRLSLGVDGGTLAADDGSFALVVPPGALTSSQEFALEPITCLAPGCLGGAWRVTPEVSFATPATVSFSNVTGVFGAQGIAYQDEGGFWHWMNEVVRDETGKTLSVQTTHLTDWSRLEGIQLRPTSATVKEGASLSLSVKICLSDEQDGLSTLMSNCDGALAPLTPITKWEVNGVQGGDGRVGTVRATAAYDATYTAPGTAPSPNTVGVTATMPAAMQGFGNVVLFSGITVGTAKELTGTFKLSANPPSAPVPISIDGSLTLTMKDDGPDETNYSATGFVTNKTRAFQLNDMTCTLQTERVDVNEKYFLKVRKEPVLAVRWSYLEQFIYLCVSPNGQMSWPVMIHFASASGPNCLPGDVPVTSASSPSGTSLSQCASGGLTSAEWTFTSAQ